MREDPAWKAYIDCRYGNLSPKEAMRIIEKVQVIEKKGNPSWVAYLLYISDKRWMSKTDQENWVKEIIERDTIGNPAWAASCLATYTQNAVNTAWALIVIKKSRDFNQKMLALGQMVQAGLISNDAADQVMMWIEDKPLVIPSKPKRSRIPHARSKIKLCREMKDSWRDLADFFGISAHMQRNFAKGRECQEVWEWLEQRQKLGELEDALTEIGREDLQGYLIFNV